MTCKKLSKMAPYVIGISSFPEQRTRTCTDYRNGQERVPIPN